MTAADWMEPWEDIPFLPRVRRVRVTRHNKSTHWRMRDGRIVAIVDMEDSHLVNTVLMIRRNATKFLAERAYSGDVPDVGAVLAKYTSYKALVAEAEFRSDLIEFRTRGSCGN